MDLFFYVVIVIVVILKIIFWVFYFYSRYKRKEIQRMLTRSSRRDSNHHYYEEQPAVPQPAFMFSQEGRSMNQYPPALPAYAEEDPAKIEHPPPPYLPCGEEIHPIVWSESVEGNSDTQQLINSNPESPT